MNLKEIINFELNNILIEFRTKFDLKKFKSIDDIHDSIDYASEHLKSLGYGSSRIAFLLSNRFVLKIAHDFNAGLVQNEAEVEIYTNPKLKPIVAKIYDFDPDYKWLVSELVRPIKNEREFEKLTDISEYKMYDIVADINKIQYGNKNIDINKFLLKYNKQDNIFLQNMLRLINQTGLDVRDLRYEHWGKTPDNRVVLLDYGATMDVIKIYYKQ